VLETTSTVTANSSKEQQNREDFFFSMTMTAEKENPSSGLAEISAAQETAAASEATIRYNNVRGIFAKHVRGSRSCNSSSGMKRPRSSIQRHLRPSSSAAAAGGRSARMTKRFLYLSILSFAFMFERSVVEAQTPAPVIPPQPTGTWHQRFVSGG